MSQPIVDGFNLGVDLGPKDYFQRYLDQYKDAKLSQRIKTETKKNKKCCKEKKKSIGETDINKCR